LEKAPDAFRIISEVASELDVPQHVLRFWESRFNQIRPMKRGGGRRYYRPDDIDLLRGIRHLLYSEGYTIRGVQRLLREQGVGYVQAAWQGGAVLPPDESIDGEGGTSTRERLLLNLLPKFGRAKNGADAAELDVTEPDVEESDGAIDDTHLSAEHADHSGASNGVSRPTAGLGREQLLQLQSALDELGECRRLIDAALAQSD
jgi:DNA-binding transcriptional MerR regulator